MTNSRDPRRDRDVAAPGRRGGWTDVDRPERGAIAMKQEELLALLVCPLGKAPLRNEGDSLVCTCCGARFAIKDGIPNMLIEEAELPEGCSSPADLVCARDGRAKGD